MFASNQLYIDVNISNSIRLLLYSLKQVGDLLNSFENRMLDTQSIEVHTIKERLDKLFGLV